MNPSLFLLEGGGSLLLISLAGVLFYKSIPLIRQEIRKRLVITLDIQNNNDELFEMFTKWLGSIEYGRKSKLMSVNLSSSSSHNKPVARTAIGNSSKTPVFSPGPGKHYFKYKGITCIVERDREKPTKDAYSISIYESYTVTLFTRNKKIAADMIDEVIAYNAETEFKHTSIYSHDSYGNWIKISQQRKRPINSVFMNKGEKQRLLDDVEEFMSAEDWYHSRGIPYKRSYLLHGPPGTGKSSIVKAIAGKYNMNIYIINAENNKANEAAFVAILGSIPPGSIILFEDIDNMYHGRESVGNTCLSFKAFINGIDGVGSPEGILLFMTTNHIDKLDPALLRPGRCDLKMEITHCDNQQIADMYESILGYTINDTFLHTLPRPITPAELQKMLMGIKNTKYFQVPVPV